MKNVKISFLTLMDGSETIAFDAVGKISGTHLFFTDGEGNVYRFETSPSTLLVAKTGKVSTKLLFQANTVTTGILTTSDMTFDLSIKTLELHLESQLIDAIYDLLDGTEVISHHQLHVQWDSIT
jgi:uncharacterized beta-barrel protein YwiB (DUF1934 family)